LRAIIARLLDKDPLTRYGSAVEVRAALQVVRQHDAHSHETRSPAAVTPPPGRRRQLVPIAAILLLVAGAVSAWFYYADAELRTLRGQTLVSNAPGAHSSPAISPDGTRVAFAAPDAAGVSQIWIQALPQGQPVPVTHGDVASSRPRWHPGGRLVFARQGAGIWTVPELGGAPRRILDRGFNPNLSADGSLVVYEWDHEIWLAGADGSNPRRLEHVPAKYYSIPATPALSPDGTQVVYFRPEAGPNGDFWIASVDGSDPPRQLTDDLREGGWPLWTTDGWILFSSARGGSRTLWQVRAEGGEPAPLTSGSGEDDHPELSRDGRLLLYTNVRKTWNLKVADEAGTERELLARLTEILFPQFSPDGRSITFFGRSDRAVAIFTIGAGGDDLRQLTGGTELNHMPRWSADGDWVYFFQLRPELSFRRVPALGGPSEAVLPFVWETHNFPQFDPSGRFLSYLHRAAGEPPRAVIRDLKTNIEHALPDPPIEFARWSSVLRCAKTR
jgi:Tol biopolymer transport system component